MEKMKLHEAFRLFRKHNERLGITTKGQDKRPLRARIVLKDTFFREDLRPLPVEKRTYAFTSDNKALIPGQLGYSVFAFCESDRDSIRIEYLQESDVESCEAETGDHRSLKLLREDFATEDLWKELCEAVGADPGATSVTIEFDERRVTAEHAQREGNE